MDMKSLFFLLICLVINLFPLPSKATKLETKPQNHEVTADNIYFGGDILTMHGDEPNYIEALATAGGKIIYTGTLEGSKSFQNQTTTMVNLEGKTMLPGFVDPHSHLYGVGLQAVVANLLPSPDGQADSIDQLVELLRESNQNPEQRLFTQKTGWIFGFGYDDSLLERYPNKQDLDRASQDKPILMIHTSGHLSVANSKALELLGINAETPNPPGGVIRRFEDSLEPNGVMEENAHFAILLKLGKLIDIELQDMMLKAAQKQYAKYGYTTAQEGRASAEAIEALSRASKKGTLLIDVVAYLDMLSNSGWMSSKYHSSDYLNRFRISGVKLSFDGSPQGKTAWLTQPYFHPPHGQTPNYLGYPTFSDEQAFQFVELALSKNWQLLTHANGDAAIGQFIDAVSAANQKLGTKDRRPVLIHGQTIRQDQIEKLSEQGIFPSLFPMHTFYWGDWHADSVLGFPRANFISPTKSVRDEQLMFSTHHDAPVALPNALRVLDATVNRTTRSRRTLGPEQRVDVYTGLKAMTLWPAYQHFEEHNKGSLIVDKQADLIILDKNPLKIDPTNLKDLVIFETISRGKSVYQQ
jgi:predicted amidohydrolase YtcJ